LEPTKTRVLLSWKKSTEENKETEDSQQNLGQDNMVSKFKCKVQHIITLAITKSTVFPIIKKESLGSLLSPQVATSFQSNNPTAY
jgi:hypothetical protein